MASIVASSGSNGSISPSGSIDVPIGTNKTFTMIPAQGYAVDNVKIDGVSIGSVASYTFGNVQANHTISVTFSNTIRIITSWAEQGGLIMPGGETPVSIGQSRTFFMNALAGYEIDDVLVDDVSVGPISTYTFYNVTANHTIKLYVKLFDSYVITASAGSGGTISPIGSNVAVKGTNKTFTITPSTHWSIADVLVDGVSVGAVSSYTFTNITESHTIAVSFSSTPYTIIATAGEHGTITPSGEITAYYGNTKSFVIIPDENYVIQDVMVDGEYVDIPASGVLYID